ncbi:MAG: hypothetical protein H7Y43_11965 [Akkermansiaceae bacterium]|nr:hypothetical protein [Verrucomicrobiales bacterium]
MQMLLTAFELTGDPSHLREFAARFDDLRSTLVKDKDGLLGWAGKPIEPLRDPAKPDVVINEIQTDFRAVGVVALFLELVERDDDLKKEFASLRKDYLDLLENHLIRRWDNSYSDLGDKGAIYRWNPDYIPNKANLTLAHEKQANMIDGYLNLYRVTKNPLYLQRAAKLGTWLKKCLGLVEGHYVWSYWDPAGAWDISPQDPAKWKHWVGKEPKAQWYAATVGSALALYHHGVVFDKQDVARFVKTQMEVCWNRDLDNPAFFTCDGKPAKEGERFIAPSLAPFEDQVAGFLYTGKRQDERVQKSADAWQGGVLAGQWLRGKYLELPAVKAREQSYLASTKDFLARPENQVFLKSLQFEVTTPGYSTPPTPAQMTP